MCFFFNFPIKINAIGDLKTAALMSCSNYSIINRSFLLNFLNKKCIDEQSMTSIIGQYMTEPFPAMGQYMTEPFPLMGNKIFID